MAENTKIEWADHSWNPWRGCTKVSAGCAHCYAETYAKRYPKIGGIWGDKGTRVIAGEAKWREPLKWQRQAEKTGQRIRVFPSLCDIFEDRPELIEPRARFFRLIADTPHIDWLLLTKRPENIIALWPGTGDRAPAMVEREGHRLLANVWLGVSVENQEQADARIPHLLRTPAAVRFLSVEPMLGPVDLENIIWHHTDGGGASAVNVLSGEYPSIWEPCSFKDTHVDWVIIGGESGPDARPFNLAWARSIIAQCRAAGVAVFMKQLGSNVIDPARTSMWPRFTKSDGTRALLQDRKGGDPSEWPEDLRIREMPKKGAPK